MNCQTRCDVVSAHRMQGTDEAPSTDVFPVMTKRELRKGRRCGIDALTQETKWDEDRFQLFLFVRLWCSTAEVLGTLRVGGCTR
jgi:hypothetical protein